MPKVIRGNKLGDGVGDTYVRVALPSAPLARGRHKIGGWALPARHRDLVGNVLSSWFRSELQHYGAHRRSQLPPEGVRSTGGLYFGKRPSVSTLLTT